MQVQDVISNNVTALEKTDVTGHVTYDPQESLELFQRTLLLHRDEDWQRLVERYQGLVLAWLRNHPRRDLALRHHEPDYYTALAFERFWQATSRNAALIFPTLEAALSYLKASLNGAILDTLRCYARPLLPLPEPEQVQPGALTREDEYGDSDTWETLKSYLPCEREKRVAYLLFHCGLKPREIVQFCSLEFPDVHEIHRLRRNIVERLLRKADLLRLRLSY